MKVSATEKEMSITHGSIETLALNEEPATAKEMSITHRLCDSISF
jgi:hypothetical protein